MILVGFARVVEAAFSLKIRSNLPLLDLLYSNTDNAAIFAAGGIDSCYIQAMGTFNYEKTLEAVNKGNAKILYISADETLHTVWFDTGTFKRRDLAGMGKLFLHFYSLLVRIMNVDRCFINARQQAIGGLGGAGDIRSANEFDGILEFEAVSRCFCHGFLIVTVMKLGLKNYISNVFARARCCWCVSLPTSSFTLLGM